MFPLQNLARKELIYVGKRDSGQQTQKEPLGVYIGLVSLYGGAVK